MSHKELNYKTKPKLFSMYNLTNEYEKDISKKYKKKEEEKIIYDNMQPKNIWLKCKNIYNKYKKDYNTLISLKKNRNDNNTPKEGKENDTNKKYIALHGNENNMSKPLSLPKNSRDYRRTKSLIFDKNMENIIKNTHFFSNRKNVKMKNENFNKNFVNRGINYIIKSRNLSDFENFKKMNKTDEEILNNSGKKKLNFFYSTKKLKGFINKLSLAVSKKEDTISYYEVNTFFEISKDDKNKNNMEEENDVEKNSTNIYNKNENLIFRAKLSLKNENLILPKLQENQKQSVFNFINLKSLLNLKDFHIFGVINGKGKEPQTFSRLLQKILIKKFSNEKNYLYAHGIKNRLKDKNFKFNYDLIYHALTLEGFIFIKKIFNSLNDEITKLGGHLEKSGATLILVILIKDKMISIKVGDMQSFFIYTSSEDNERNIISKKPHLEHLINNILEQDRFEEKCKFNQTKDEIGNNEYEIITENEEIQKIINNEKIKYTRVIGYTKLGEIGFISEPDIQVLNYNYVKDNNKNSSYINDDLYKLKYVILGNNELFEYLKIRYYIKEINGAFLKDKENKNYNNIKYWFNLKNVVKKLVNDSVELYKKYRKKDNFKESCMALITFT